MWCIKFQQSQGSVHRFCGTETFPVPEFYSYDRTAIVTFKSDEYMINNGVRFSYQATGKPEEMSQKNLLFSLFISYIEKQYRDLKSLHVSGFLSQGCSREYNQTFGYLKSPGWPGPHPNNMDYSIILQAPPNHTISLFFHDFSLEDSIQCSRDFLEVSCKCTYFVSLCKNLLNSKNINKFGSSLDQVWVELTELGTNLLL